MLKHGSKVSWLFLPALIFAVVFGLGSLDAAPPASSPISQPIRYLPEQKLWILETANTSYVVGINEQNGLQNLYWGKKVTHDEDFAPAHTADPYAYESPESMATEEYPGWGGLRYSEPCLKVTLNDGTRDLVLKYVSHQIRGDVLEIRTRDIKYDLFVSLVYRVYPRYDIIRKQTVIENQTKQPLVLESAQSAVWYMPRGVGYWLSYLPGRWAGENQLTHEEIHQGKKVLESRRLVTSHQMNPWFAIDYLGMADEDQGRVWFGGLGWSGNWKIVVEQTPNQQVRVTGGYNDFDFAYPLKPGESLATPPFYGGYSDAGFGEASRRMHAFERAEILPSLPAPRPRPVIFNSWCVTRFAANEENQMAFADAAARLGVELFMMDDGWFSGRQNDREGLGDWWPDPAKFPQGLKPLIDHVHGLGMEFGLWIEPEMVNPNSQLYHQHPDWVINFPGRPRSEARHQLILNLARQDVKEYIFNVFDKLLAENEIKMVKWDMNRHVSEPGWPQMPAPEEKQLWVKYVANFYEIVDRLRAKHPGVEFETSQGGGGRVDLGILTRMEQVNTSDNGDAFDRLRIWEGYTYAYAPRLLGGFVVDNPGMHERNTPLQFRFLVAMMGGPCGICADIRKWSPEELEQAKKLIAYYKTIRRTMQEGDLYRLNPPREGNMTAAGYVAPDGKQAVFFILLHSQQFLFPAPTVCLRGLDEKALYRLTSLDDKLADTPRVLSGSYLMNRGLDFKLRGDFDSTSVLLERITGR
jgi:alpha-galactosidase